MAFKKYNKHLTFLLFTCSLFAFTCENTQAPENNLTTGQIAGSTKKFGNGTATPFIETIINGPPVNVGTALTGNIFSGLDSINNVFTYLEFTPTNNNTAFNHITVRWNTPGFIKSEVLLKPHIAIDFNLLAESDQNNIRASDSSIIYRTPLQNETPADYKMLKNSATDKVGALFYDSTSASIPEGNLTRDILYGYYNGKMVLYEIVVSIDYLKSLSKVSGAIKQPEVFPQEGFYPTKYVFSYDSVKDTFTFALYEFVKH